MTVSVHGPRANGRFTRDPRTLTERFEERIEPEPNSGCWLWNGCSNYTGYGFISVGGKNRLAHRIAYELHRGPIADGMTLDHTCRNRRCVNPSHLEVVSLAVNILRGEGATARHARKTHCPRGHPYDYENTYRSRGRRYCRRCHRLRPLSL